MMDLGISHHSGWRPESRQPPPAALAPHPSNCRQRLHPAVGFTTILRATSAVPITPPVAYHTRKLD